MGAAALGLGLMAAGQIGQSYGDNESNKAMRSVVSAEDARQAALNNQLMLKQRALLKTGSGAPNIPQQQAQVVQQGAQFDNTAKGITDAVAANSGAAPASTRAGIISGAAGVSDSSRVLSQLIARRLVMMHLAGSDQQAQDLYGNDRQRISDRAAGSQALLPYELEAAARAGGAATATGQALGMGGQALFSYGVNKKPATAGAAGGTTTTTGTAANPVYVSSDPYGGQTAPPAQVPGSGAQPIWNPYGTFGGPPGYTRNAQPYRRSRK